MGTRLAGVAVHLPERRVSSADVEGRVGATSAAFTPPPGLIRRLTGIESRHVMDDDGTAHIVAAKLKLTCPVMDVKNACKSVLNGIEMADALITSGRYRQVLVVSGEAPSRAARRGVGSLAGQLRAFPGYTLSDGGAAMLLTADAPPDTGVLATAFTADSWHWEAGTLAAGGSRHPREVEHTYFAMDGARLRAAFLAVGTGILDTTLTRLGLGWTDFAVVGVHQVSLPHVEVFAERAGVPADRHVITVAEHGNVASTRPRASERRSPRWPRSETRTSRWSWWTTPRSTPRPTWSPGSPRPTRPRGSRSCPSRNAGRVRPPTPACASRSGVAPPTSPAPTPTACPRRDRTSRISSAFTDGLELVCGRLLPRTDEGLAPWRRGALVGAVAVASTFGRYRPGNRIAGARGPYVMAAGSPAPGISSARRCRVSRCGSPTGASWSCGGRISLAATSAGSR